MGTGTGTGTMLDVTQSWMAREQQVVVPLAAQHGSGRVVWSRSVIVSCVAGQQIAICVPRVWSVSRMSHNDVSEQGGGGGGRTLQREQADERRKWGVVHAPALQQARGELQALPARQDRLHPILVGTPLRFLDEPQRGGDVNELPRCTPDQSPNDLL